MHKHASSLSVTKTLIFASIIVTLTFTLSSVTYAQLSISASFAVSQMRPNIPTGLYNRPVNGPISTIGVDPRSENNVMVASETGGVFRSIDGARHWRHRSQDWPRRKRDGMPVHRWDRLARATTSSPIANRRS